MKPIILIFILSATLLSGCSCSKKEETWGQVEMWKMALSKEPSIELVFLSDTPDGNSRRVLCSQYSQDGCVVGSGKRIKVRMVEILVLQFEKQKQACLAALAIHQWYARNWLFDDVTNEPVLIDFVKNVFSAKKPESAEDCDL
jgi:hypothetical protein